MPAALLQKLQPLQNARRVIVHNQAVGDIMQGILRTHTQYEKEYDRIADQFKGRNGIEVAKKVFDYLKANTHYRIEKDNAQTLRSPAAILALGANPRIGLDCKSYALFIAGVLSAWQRRGMKINWCYRFASYKIVDKLPHHVFVVIGPGTDNEVFVDPVLPTFNYRKSYTYKIDRKPMSLIAISGIGRVKRTAAEKKQRREQLKKKIKADIKKKGKLLVKFNPATATARNAFLLLVKLNIFNLGRKLYQAQTKDAGKLKSWWEKLGGNYRTLAINIGLGAKKQPQFGFVVAAGTTAAIASATPLILKVKEFLKSMGISTDDIKKIGGKLIQKTIEKKLDAKADELASQEEGETPIDQDAADDMDIPKEAEQALTSETNEESSGDEIAGFPTNTLLIGGAALAAAYFLTRKK